VAGRTGSQKREEIREAFGWRCWIQYMPHAAAIEVREIGWGKICGGCCGAHAESENTKRD
jgi:hypothetical protein